MIAIPCGRVVGVMSGSCKRIARRRKTHVGQTRLRVAHGMINDGAMSSFLSNETQSAERQKQALELALRCRTYDCLEIRCSDDACYLVVTILGTPTVLGDGSGDAKGFRHAWQIQEWLHSRFELVVDRPAGESYRWAPRKTANRVAKEAGVRRCGARLLGPARALANR